VSILQVYKCKICKKIIEIIKNGQGHLICCGVPMTFQIINSINTAKEKHEPIIKKIPNGYKIKIGDLPHPMNEKHYIQWIEIFTHEKIYRIFLKPGKNPEVDFIIDTTNITARGYCNIHGLWQKTTILKN